MHQAGSYVGPDKLRFDFSHGQGMSAQELRDVEDQINAWIVENHPVRPISTTLAEARALGAMALFGEKYGEIVRMVEVGDGDFSRELCGGTHVRSTAEIGVVRILSETSSAANVRRIEALSGPAAIASLRDRSVALEEIASILRTAPEQAVSAVHAREAERRELEKAVRASARPAAMDVAALAESAEMIGEVPVVCAVIEVPDAKALLDVVDRVKGQLEKDGAIILAGVVSDRAHVVVSVAATLVERGVRAGEIAKAAAAVLGGGGGGRDTLAQAGGSEVGRIGEALDAARAALQGILGG